MATKNIKINFTGLDYDVSSTFTITSNTGESQSITYNQLTHTGPGYDFAISDSATSITVSSDSCSPGVEASTSFDAVATITPTPTSTNTPTPAVNTDTPTPTPTSTPVGPTFYPVVGSSLLGDFESACNDDQDVTYYITESNGVAPQVQLYNTENISDPVTSSGTFISFGNKQYNVANGQLGSEGSCPVIYNHAFYISAAKSAPSGFCDNPPGGYLISSTKSFNTDAQSFDLSQLLNRQIFDGQQPWTPQAAAGSYYAVSKSPSSTEGGVQFTWITVDADGIARNTGTYTCPENATPTPVAPTATPIPGDGTTPVPDRPDTPEEQ